MAGQAAVDEPAHMSVHRRHAERLAGGAHFLDALARVGEHGVLLALPVAVGVDLDRHRAAQAAAHDQRDEELKRFEHPSLGPDEAVGLRGLYGGLDAILLGVPRRLAPPRLRTTSGLGLLFMRAAALRQAASAASPVRRPRRAAAQSHGGWGPDRAAGRAVLTSAGVWGALRARRALGAFGVVVLRGSHAPAGKSPGGAARLGGRTACGAGV